MSALRDMLREFFHKGDVVLLTLCLVASGVGLVLIYSATRFMTSLHSSVMTQLVAICLGVVAYIILSFVDIELFTEKSWKWMLLFNVVIILLLLTPFGIGKEETGNNSWLSFPFLPMNIQPAEIAKLFFVLLMAYQCARYEIHGISHPKSIVLMAGHAGFMCGIIALVSGDFGMVLVFLFLFVIMAWVAGVQKRWFVLGAGVVTSAFWLVWPYLTENYQYITNRFTVIFTRDDPLGSGWQQERSILAIGSGQLTGQGYLQGVQTQSSGQETLPARWTDEIFAVCGEEFGLIGCVVVILLILAIVGRCCMIAHQAATPMSAYVVMGYAGMMMIQMVLNIGMCLYVFPVVGLTLPFISYGGSSIITLFAAMGIVSSVKMRSLPSWLKNR